MVFEMLEQYGAIVDGLQLFLCLLILFFLVRNHRRKMKPDSMNPKSEPGQDFNFQVFSQTINQQVELAFNNILQAAANERRNLDKVLQFQQFKYAEGASPGTLPPSLRPRRDGTSKSVEEITGQGERQTRIQKLATRGMSAKQISDELRTPLGEVELILSLQKKQGKSKNPT